MTRDTFYDDVCPKCSKLLKRKKENIGKLCNPCSMSAIGFARAEQRRANPKRKTVAEYSKRSRALRLKRNPLEFRLKRSLSAAKTRSRLTNVDFDLTLEYLFEIYPKDEMCPILKVSFVWGTRKDKEFSPSIDRMIPEKGYVKGNVKFICYKANRIKSDSTIDILQKLIRYMSGENV
jgi:hypothetical protein